MTQREQLVELLMHGQNCSQAILSVYGPLYGLDQELAKSLGRVLGGGLGRLGETCGAITAAMLVVGLAQVQRDDEASARNELSSMIKELCSRFKKSHGALSCRVLLQADISTEIGMKKIMDEQLIPKTCPAFVNTAAVILSDIIMSNEVYSTKQSG